MRLSNEINSLKRKIATWRKSSWLYVAIIIAFLIDAFWISFDGLYPPFYLPSFQYAGKTYLSLLGFLIVANLALINYFLRHIYELSEPVENTGEIAEVDAKFLIDRSDNLDREIHYLRSGVSILAGVFSGVIVLLWDPNRVLQQIEMNAIFLLSILVFFSVVSIFLSFGSTKVTWKGHKLGNDLVPGKYSVKIYEILLRGIVDLKQSRLNRMTGVIVLGLSFFLGFGALFAVNTILIPIGYGASVFPLESSLITGGFFILIVLFPFSITIEMELTGIAVLDDTTATPEN